MMYNVEHNKEDNLFEIVVDGATSFIQYEINEGEMIFLTTQVPKEMEGKGIASTLTKIALDYALENGLKIVPLCSFTSTYIKRHKEYDV